MRRLYLIIVLGLVVLFTNSYSSHFPAEKGLYQVEVTQELDISISDFLDVLDTSKFPAHTAQSAAVQPVVSVLSSVPDVSEYDPQDVLLYIKEQCYLTGVNYNFAVSLLREENTAFFRWVDGASLQKIAVEARGINDNGSTDFGLWQLNGNFLWINFVPNYWHGLCEFNWMNPYHNTYIAVRHIKWLYTNLQRNHSDKGSQQLINTVYWETALAYNSGLDRVRSGSRPSEKTLDYAARILERVF